MLAGGKLEQQGEATVMSVKATAGDADFGIVQSPFMLAKAKTKAFEMMVTLDVDTLECKETTYL